MDTTPTAVHGAIHLYVPIHTKNYRGFRTKLLRKSDWTRAKIGANASDALDARFYMRYIKQIFGAGQNGAENPLGVNCLVLQNDTVNYPLSVWEGEVEHKLTIESARLFSFDTSIAILDLRASVSAAELKSIANVCAALRVTNAPLTYNVSLGSAAADEITPATITVNDIATALLSGVRGYTLFDHIGSGAETRADVFSAIIADENIADKDLNLYRIAAGIDARGETNMPTDALFTPFPHLRWAVTGKGACSLGLLTGDERNRDFIQNRWISIAEKRHALWYVLVLHQKYAMYRYLNDIADKSSLGALKEAQKNIVFFNTRYRFEVVSEDTTYQTLYTMARSAKLVESVFSDIDEEIERINDYNNTVSDKNNVIAMTIVSLVCAISTFIDIFQFSVEGASITEFVKSLSLPQIFLFAVVALAIFISVAFLVIKPLVKWLGAKTRKLFSHVYSALFLR